MQEMIFVQRYRMCVWQVGVGKGKVSRGYDEVAGSVCWRGEVYGVPWVSSVETFRSAHVAFAMLRNRIRAYLRWCYRYRVIPAASFSPYGILNVVNDCEIYLQERVALSVLLDFYRVRMRDICALFSEDNTVFDANREGYVKLAGVSRAEGVFRGYMIFDFNGVYEYCDLVDGCLCDDYCFIVDNAKKKIVFRFFEKDEYRNRSVLYLRVSRGGTFSIDAIVVEVLSVGGGKHVFRGKSHLLQYSFYSVNESVLCFAMNIFGGLDLSNRYVFASIYYFAIMLTSTLCKSGDDDESNVYQGENFSSVLKLDRFYISLRNKRAVDTVFRNFDIGNNFDILEGSSSVEIYVNEFLRSIAVSRWADISRRGGVKDKAFAVVVIGRYSGKKLERIFRSLSLLVEKPTDECAAVYRELRLKNSKAHKQKILNMLKKDILKYAMAHDLPMPPPQMKSLRGRKGKNAEA